MKKSTPAEVSSPADRQSPDLTAAAADSHIRINAPDGVCKVSTTLIFPGPVVLGRISGSATSGTVTYRRLYASSGGATGEDGSGSAIIPILR